MKIRKISLGLFVVLLAFVSSCRDFVDPNIPYSEFDTGLYLRTIRAASTNSLSLNFFDLQNSRFNVTVEAVDEKEGTSVSSVEVRIRHRRLIPGVGLEYTPAQSGGQRQEVTVATISGSEFTQSPDNRFKRTVIDVSAAAMIQAVGLTADQIEGGDVFEVRLYATDDQGRVFGPDNRSSDVAGGFFYDSPFLYNVAIVCPSDLAGTYRYESTEMQSAFGSCAGTITGEVSLTVADSNNPQIYVVSDATFGFWGCYGDTWGSGNVRLNDSCGILSFSGADKYGDGYTIEVLSNTGSELRFIWVNNSNETGTVTLFANEGSPWPDTLR